VRVSGGVYSSSRVFLSAATTSAADILLPSGPGGLRPVPSSGRGVRSDGAGAGDQAVVLLVTAPHGEEHRTHRMHSEGTPLRHGPQWQPSDILTNASNPLIPLSP
jgi:hypothetical protein